MVDTRTVTVIVGSETSGAERGLEGLRRSATKLQGTVSGTSSSVEKFGMQALKAFGAASVIDGIRRVVGGATDLAETVNKTRVIFGASSPAIEKWGSTAADSMGMSTRAALDGASSFGNLFTQIGITGDVAVKMSLNMVKLASDFASFQNAKPEAVMNAMMAATRGEYDALQKFVPTVTDASIQQLALSETGKKAAKSLTAAEKATALYDLVVRDAGAATGDFARTADGAANRQRKLAANIEDTADTIGAKLTPAYSGLLGAINSVGVGTVIAGAAVALLANRLQNSASKVDSMGRSTGAIGKLLKEYRFNVADAAEGTSHLGAVAGGVARTGLTGMKSALSGVMGVLGGPWGLAITAATIGIGSMISAHQQATVAAEKQDEAYAQLAQDFKASTSTITASNMSAFYKQLASDAGMSTEEISAALKRVGLSTDQFFKQWQNNSPEFAATLTRMEKEFVNWTGATAGPFQDVDRGLYNVGRRYQQSTNKAAEFGKEMTDAAPAVEKASQLYTDYADAMKAGGVSADQFGKVLSDIGESGGSTTSMLGRTVAVIDDITKASISAAEKSDLLKKALDGIYGAAIDVNEAGEDWQSNLDKLTDSVKENGNSLSINTAKGRDNRDALEAAALSNRTLYRAEIASGLSAKEAAAKHKIRDDRLRGEAKAANLSKSETSKLIAEYGSIPPSKITKVSIVGSDKVFKDLLYAYSLQRALTLGLSPGAARTAANEMQRFAATSGTRAVMKAAGGKVDGWSPNDRADNIPAWLTAGEYVHPVSTVDYYGDHAMDALRHRIIPRELLDPSKLHAFSRAIGRPRSRQPGDGSHGIAFADGGSVWPFPIDMSKTKIPADIGALQGGLGAVAWLKAQNDKPYIWASAGPAGYDCSGLVSAVYNILKGRSPYSHTFSTMNEAGYFKPGRGMSPLNVGWANPGEQGGGSVGHTAGELYGIPFESGGSWGRVHVGAGATPIGSFAHVGHYDKGGLLPPGWTAAFNGTGRSEYVSADAPANVTVNVVVQGNVTAEKDLAKRIATDVRDELLRHAGRNGGRTGL